MRVGINQGVQERWNARANHLFIAPHTKLVIANFVHWNRNTEVLTLEFSNSRIPMAKKLVVTVDYSGDISDATTESSN